MGYEYMVAERLARKYRTRDPYELLDCIGAILEINHDYDPDGLKGFSTILRRTMFAVINGHLDEHERRVVAGHEAAHLILHKNEILQSPTKTFEDFNLYDNSGRLEYQANSFLSDFIVSDKEVLEAIVEVGNDYFASARLLCIPPPLYAFKLHSMMSRNHDVISPVSLHSGFLGGKGDMW